MYFFYWLKRKLIFKVQSVPTVIAFKNGKAIAQFVGVIDDDKITKFITDAVEAK